MQYDAAGNLAGDGQESFSYDATGQQTFASGSSLSQYYDGDGVRAALQPALNTAGIHGFRFHDFRHRFGTRLGEAGVSPFVIAELMGHAYIKMTARYTHPTETGKRAAVEVLRTPKEKSGHRRLQRVG